MTESPKTVFKEITESEIWEERKVTGIWSVFLGNDTVYMFAYLFITWNMNQAHFFCATC